MKKRPLSSGENFSPAVALKQTKLMFGGGNQLMLEKLPKESPKELPKELPSDLPNDLPKEPPKELPSGLPNDLPSDLPKELPSDLPTELPSDLPKELPDKEKPKLIDSDKLFETAIAPLQGNSWMTKLESELRAPYMQKAFKKISEEANKKKIIYPPTNLIFNAFVLSPLNDIRVVIIGQDPYHNVGQAHGLSFSVPHGIKQPPSLKNIFKELSKEYPTFVTPTHGSLIKWAEQGVFLLNATLTVEKDSANSHRDFGWQRFTDFVIKTISKDLTGVVFLLWGNFAQKKAEIVDKKKHTVIKTAHPSPLSYRKFTDCGCFTQTNEALVKMGKEPIDWNNL